MKKNVKDGKKIVKSLNIKTGKPLTDKDRDKLLQAIIEGLRSKYK